MAYGKKAMTVEELQHHVVTSTEKRMLGMLQAQEKQKWRTYCGLTCLGGSEARQCDCESALKCKLRDDPDFPRVGRR